MLTQEGKLAKELDFVSHHVRTKLDELKRQEVNRLRTLIKAKQDLEGGNGMTLPTTSKHFNLNPRWGYIDSSMFLLQQT